MTTRNYYSPEQKAAIAALHWDEKQTLSQISRENKISISAVRRWVREYSPAVNDNGEAINTLNEKVKEIVDARDYLQWKIDNYDSHMIESENKL